MSTFAIEMHGITKRFGRVLANEEVALHVRRGTIHGVIGENGAGKSTCMSILYGYYRADSGVIRVGGREVTIRNSHDAIALGIGMVHQHFMLVDTFTVLENIVLGVEGGVILASGMAAARKRLAELNAEFRLEVNPDALVGSLAVGLRQRVEILKALYRGAEVLILDEPTAVLTPHEAEDLFSILRTLKEQGKTCVIITHKLREVIAVTDYVTVMRAGKTVGEVATRETDAGALARMMIGRVVDLQVARSESRPGDVVLSVHGLGLRGARGVTLLDEVSFEVRAGEIVGIAGVTGNGQSELLEVLSGLREPNVGHFEIKGCDPRLGPKRKTKADRVRDLGVGHVPEDRLSEGVVKGFSVAENAILGRQRAARFRRHKLLSRASVREHCQRLIARFDVRPNDPDQRIALLSGGNQQKLVLARELDANPDLLLVGQPTRGVDIGAIEFIRKQLAELRAAGKAILLVSVELDEILALSDRILVMCDGRLTGELRAVEASAQQLGLLFGGHAE